MSALVIDASVAAAWLFEDESDPRADTAYSSVQVDDGFVPQHWHFEMRNSLLMAERRDRISEDAVGDHLITIGELQLHTDSAPDLDAAFALARAHRLTFYDALYMELALRRKLPLATLDNALERAAIAEGLPPLPQP